MSIYFSWHHTVKWFLYWNNTTKQKVNLVNFIKFNTLTPPVLSIYGNANGCTGMVIETRSNQYGPGNFLQFSHWECKLCIRWVVSSPLVTVVISIITLRFRWARLMLWFLGILLLPWWLRAGLQSLWYVCQCPTFFFQCVFFQCELTLLRPDQFFDMSTGRQTCRGYGGTTQIIKVKLITFKGKYYRK